MKEVFLDLGSVKILKDGEKYYIKQGRAIINKEAPLTKEQVLAELFGTRKVD